MEKEVSKIIQKCTLDFIELASNYINQSIEIQSIYIYVSIEWSGYFNIYFKKDDLIVKKNRINELTKLEIDVSEDAQMLFMKSGNAIVKSLKKELQINDITNTPSQIKIVYNNFTKGFDLDISYEKILDENKMIGATECADKWFLELGGELHPNTLAHLEGVFGKNFMSNE